MTQALRSIDRLQDILLRHPAVAVAVSGGVDSMTLATVAASTLGRRATMYHAVSPAVPPEATGRVKALAASEAWALELIDAGEFSRDDYLSNPVNRCFFCKESLYSTIRRHVGAGAQILSGTNRDDLSDYRPGLIAASQAGVQHPFVEAGLRKGDIRAMAAALGLGEIAELPASPCLSSRVETGIPVLPELLGLVQRTEAGLRQLLNVGTVRCRYRARGIVLELDEAELAQLSPQQSADALAHARAVFSGSAFEGPVTIAPYRRGSAFLRDTHAQRRPA
ncbi:hypothetical protein [Ramlibacter sp.]|uniref:hypothetical protein n=1 Tax=Ramlibacter sp. TaxID=1917967 RepID=UPI002FC788A1